MNKSYRSSVGFSDKKKTHRKSKHSESFEVGIYSTIHINKQEKIPINKTIKTIMLYSRQNYIRHFAFYLSHPLKDSMNVDEILSAQSNFTDTLPACFPNSEQITSIGKDIVTLYKKENELVALATKLQTPKDISIFANIIIPAMFGFYLDSFQEEIGFKLIYSFLTYSNYQQAKPFFISYLFSSTLFFDFFWEDLFVKISKSSEEPSYFYLQELLLDTLKSSLNCFSKNQVNLLASLLKNSYEDFHNLFFEELILQTFDILNYSNRLQIDKLKILFNYFKTNEACIDRIRTIFNANCYGCHLPSILPTDNNSKIKELVICLSYRELQLLSDLILAGNEGAKERKFEPPSDVDPNAPFYLRIPYSHKASPPLPHQKGGKSSFFISDSLLTFTQMEIESDTFGISPFLIFDNCYDDEFNSYDLCKLKREYEADKTNMMDFIKIEGATSKLNFNKLLDNKQKMLNLFDIKKRVKYHLNRHETSFYSKIPSEKLENIPMVLELNEYQSQYEPFTPCRHIFAQYILNLSMNDSKYKTFVLENKDYLMELKHLIRILDNSSICTRIFILENILMAISALCQLNTRWINPTFLNLLKQSDLWPVFEVLIVFYKFKKDKPERCKEIEKKLEYVIKLFEFMAQNFTNIQTDELTSPYDRYDFRAINSVLKLEDFNENRPDPPQ